MNGIALHITNGDELTEKMQELNLPGEIVIWREMLCEGPTIQDVGSKDSIEIRKKFLEEYYNIPADDYENRFLPQLKALEEAKDYDYIVLWFEFDLFCHINMMAAISYFSANKEQKPVYLVCSKKLEGEEDLQPLSRLTPKQLMNHYNHKITLTNDDLEMAVLIWELYCSNNPMQLKQQIKKTTNFEYLSSCIRAHIERFPNSVTGINSQEKHILKLIKKNNISTINQLLGYSMQYQGYYGYSDSQMKRMLDKLKIFYTIEDNKVVLTEKGEQAFAGTKNFYRELKSEEWFGGAKMYDFLYDSESHRLLKL